MPHFVWLSASSVKSIHTSDVRYPSHPEEMQRLFNLDAFRRPRVVFSHITFIIAQLVKAFTGNQEVQRSNLGGAFLFLLKTHCVLLQNFPT